MSEGKSIPETETRSARRSKTGGAAASKKAPAEPRSPDVSQVIQAPTALTRLDPGARAATIGGLQQSAGNAAVQRLISSVPSHGGGGLAIQRDRSTDLNDMAEAGGQQAASDEQKEAQNRTQPPVQVISNITDAREARVLAERIESWRPHMQEGAGADGAFTVSPNRVTPAKMAANEQVVGSLDDYLITAGEQSRTLGSFQDALQKARVDYERLQAQVTHLTVTNAIAGGSAADIGQQVVSAAGLGDADAAQRQLQQVDRDPAMLAVHNQVQGAHDQMVTLSQQVGAKQSAVSTAAYDYEGKLNQFKTGIPSVNTNPDQAAQLNELKEKIEKVKQYVGKGLEWAAKGAEAAGVEGADKAVAPLEKVADFLTDQFYDNQLNDINTKIQQYNTAHQEHAITASLDAVRASARTFTQSIRDFGDTREAFAHAQTTFRDQLRAFGRSADRGHGDKFAQIASVLAEVDTYETQLDDALRLAMQEQAAAQEAASARRTVGGGPGQNGAARQQGMPYYEPYRTFHNNGGWGYECMQQEVNLPAILTGTGGSGTAGNANRVVDEAVQTLQGYRREVDGMRASLAKAMDLRMDNAMPTSAGGPAPTARSSNQGL